MAQVQQHFGEREPPLRLRLEDAIAARAQHYRKSSVRAMARAAQPCRQNVYGCDQKQLRCAAAAADANAANG